MSELVLTPGKSVTVTTFVDETKTARCVGSGSLDVFATPMMVAQMEYAACEVLKSAMDEGQTSVGTFISVNHTAASPLGAQIITTATITSVSGRKVDFDVSSFDDCGEIGRGTHTRMIVDTKRFTEKIDARRTLH